MSVRRVRRRVGIGVLEGRLTGVTERIMGVS
jgi:hypothetical protein